MSALTIYTLLSFLLTSATIYYAYRSQEQFYFTVLYLVRSKYNLLVLFNFCVSFLCLLCLFIVREFFTQLKPAEVQEMQSTLSHYGFKLLITMYVLHTDFDGATALKLAVMLAVHAIMTITIKRIEYVISTQIFTEQLLGLKVYFKMLILHGLLLTVTYSLYAYFYDEGVFNKFLAFEFLFHCVKTLQSLSTFLICLVDKVVYRSAWDSKGDCLNFSNFLFGTAILVVIIYEFYVMARISQLYMIHFLDQTIEYVIQIHTSLSNFIQSRKLISKAEAFPDATPEEIQAANDRCIICFEQMQTAKRINCGHLFHLKCLRGYFQANSTPKCPTCLAPIEQSAPVARPLPASLQELEPDTEFLYASEWTAYCGSLPWGLPAPAQHRLHPDSMFRAKKAEQVNELLLHIYRNPPCEAEEEL